MSATIRLLLVCTQCTHSLYSCYKSSNEDFNRLWPTNRSWQLYQEVALRLLLNVPLSRTVTKWGSRTTSDGDGGGTPPPPDMPSFFPYLVLGQVNFVI